MSDALAVLGIIHAVAAPLLLLPFFWLAWRHPGRALAARLPERDARWRQPLALTLATGIVALPVLALYLPGRYAYERICEAETRPVIAETTRAEGYFRSSLYPYEAQLILGQGQFAFVEGPDMYHRGAYIRYTLNAVGDRLATPMDQPSADYLVDDEHAVLSHGISIHRKRIVERASGRELARAASAVYHGGAAAWLLGAHGLSSCPDIRSRAGSRDFDTYYHLETRVLGAPAPSDATLRTRRPAG